MRTHHHVEIFRHSWFISALRFLPIDKFRTADVKIICYEMLLVDCSSIPKSRKCSFSTNIYFEAFYSIAGYFNFVLNLLDQFQYWCRSLESRAWGRDWAEQRRDRAVQRRESSAECRRREQSRREETPQRCAAEASQKQRRKGAADEAQRR